jgi:hypothetical protein
MRTTSGLRMTKAYRPHPTKANEEYNKIILVVPETEAI